MTMEQAMNYITLFVAVATLVVSVLAYRYARQSDRKRIKDELARKEAKLQSIVNHGFTMGLSQAEWNAIKPIKQMLEAEIIELKSQLK